MEQLPSRFSLLPSRVDTSSLSLSLAVDDFTGKLGSTQMLYSSDGKHRILFVGLGEESEIDGNSIRKGMNTAVRSLCLSLSHHRDLNIIANVLLPSLPPSHELSRKELVDTAARGFILSNHHFDKYLDKPKKTISGFNLILKDTQTLPTASLKPVMTRAIIAAEGTLLARELANEQSDVASPAYLEEVARNIADSHSLNLTVVNEEDLLKENLHLLRAVGQGCTRETHKPRIVTLLYRGNPSSSKTEAIIGKGITFDTGGLNLKPTNSIENMHLDMGGAAAVLGAIKSIASMKLRVNVVACIALAENAIGDLAQKPYAIVPSRKGTIQISNTDAEGRLALADAFSYVQEHFKVSSIIDIATLTGACVMALGNDTAGLFTNDSELGQSLYNSGEFVEEPLWELPVTGNHTDLLKGDYFNYKSSGGKPGSSTAAAFLHLFVDEGVHWAHIDIAGPGMSPKESGCTPKGGTGFGAQVLVEHFVRNEEVDPEFVSNLQQAIKEGVVDVGERETERERKGEGEGEGESDGEMTNTEKREEDYRKFVEDLRKSTK